MATGGLNVGGDVEQALENVGVPSYVLDATGIARWLNPAAERLVGDVRGRHLTSVVAAEDKPGARERFAQKMLGTALTSEATGHLVSSTGTRVPVEVSAVALKNGERVVGVFGLFEERPDDSTKAPPAHLTPRQVEVLSSRAGPLDEADRRRAPSEPRDGQKPRPPSLPSPRRQHPTRSRRRRAGRITPVIGRSQGALPVDAVVAERHGRSRLGASTRAPIDLFGSTTGHLSGRIVQAAMTLTDLLVASTPIIVLMFWLVWRGIPTLIDWRRERKYQAEWHRTFGGTGRRSS